MHPYHTIARAERLLLVAEYLDSSGVFNISEGGGAIPSQSHLPLPRPSPPFPSSSLSLPSPQPSPSSGGNNFNYFSENRTLILHVLPYAKKFQSSKGGGHGPSGPMVNTPLLDIYTVWLWISPLCSVAVPQCTTKRLLFVFAVIFAVGLLYGRIRIHYSAIYTARTDRIQCESEKHPRRFLSKFTAILQIINRYYLYELSFQNLQKNTLMCIVFFTG